MTRRPDAAFPHGPVAAIAIAGVAIRLILVFLTPEWSVSTDGARFRRLADTGMEGTAFIPPLYPFFLRAVSQLTGTDALAPVRIAQSLLGGVTCWLAALLAARLAAPGRRRRSAVLAAALCAFTPPLLIADLTILSESITALLLTAWIVAAASAGEPPGRRAAPGSARAAGAGALIGFAALARSPLLLFILARPILLRLLRAGGLRRALLASAVACLVILPWTVRNTLLFDRFVPISTNGGYNFWKSFHEESTGTESGYDLSLFAGIDEKEYDAAGYHAGLAFIRDHPLRALALAPLKIGHLFGLERLFFIGVREGFWGPLPGGAIAAAALLIPATQIFWVFFATQGLVRLPPSNARRECLLLIGFTCALHLVFNAEARYHVPLVPAFLALAGAGLFAPAPQGAPAAGRFLPAVVVTLVVGFWGYEILSEWASLGATLL